MAFQYTYDAKGKPVGVFIPINEWETITGEIKNVKAASKSSGKKKSILDSIKKGLQQVEQIQQNKLKSIPIKQLLNEL